MSYRAFVAVAAMLISGACSNSTEVSRCNEANPEVAVAPPASDSGWRAKVLRSLEGSPADSGAHAVFYYSSAVTVADSLLLSENGGTITYSFRGFPALLANMTVGNLRRFASEVQTPRVSNAFLGRSLELLTCTASG
ncbi:MAG: hypothetical protein ABR543_14485 [Gemmatimonadaceae bacterium]